VLIQVGRAQQFTVEALTNEDVKKIEKAVSRCTPPVRLPAEDANQGGTYIPGDADRRRLVERQIKERRGQQDFRNALRKRYGDCCQVTGCKVLAVIEAAHIKPYQGEEDNHPENGLSLRSDIHTLFDLDLLGIEPSTLRIELHPDVAREYKKYIDKTISCLHRWRPSKEALKLRYELFKKTS
jgi:putative restriction endonuclease